MTRPNTPFPRPLLAMMAAFAGLIVGLALVLWYRLEYEELCPQCARTRTVQDWLVPFTERPYYSFATVEESALTKALEEFQYVDPHEHPWLLISGTGPGPKQNLGGGLVIAQGVLSPSVAELVRLLHRHTDEKETAYWLARMTMPQHAYMVRNVADACVKESYADAATFRTRLNEIKWTERQLQIYRLGEVDEPEVRTPPRLLHQRPPR